jgi:hypothetical protein
LKLKDILVLSLIFKGYEPLSGRSIREYCTPFIAGPLIRSVYSSSDIAQQLFYLMLMIGGYHQVASVYLYFDSDAKKIINRHKWYFYFWPLMIAASIMLFYLVDNLWLESYLLQAYAMLTIYHYQKQNIKGRNTVFISGEYSALKKCSINRPGKD